MKTQSPTLIMGYWQYAASDLLEKEYRKEHSRLETMIDAYARDFKSGKRSVYQAAEDVLKEERMQRLIAEAG